MDILDILIAKKKSFTGETEKLVRQANEAMAAANEVAEKIDEAEDLLSVAQEVTSYAQEAASNLDQIQNNITSAVDEMLDNKISSSLLTINENITNLQTATTNSITSFSVENNNTSSYKGRRAKIRKNNVDTTYDIEKNYTTIGQNEDGSMTQKAITNALNNQKNELETRINNININGGSGGSGNVSGDFSSADEGNLVIVGENGNITAGSTSEADLIKTQILVGTYVAKEAVGIEIDYKNKTIKRIQESIGLNAGQNFNKYPMFGGRRRCIVKDDGEIYAFYGEQNYIEDGSVGQVMVYQPKFYYLRMPINTTIEDGNEIITKEILMISAVKQSGFKVHPIFLDKNNNELDYVFLSAYEGCAYNNSNHTYNTTDEQNITYYDSLSSIAGAKPISGLSQAFNIQTATQMGENRGEGWSLSNLEAESVNQMLMIIEYGSLNLQSAFNEGITTLNWPTGYNCSCITGSTSSLGSTSGRATSTTQTRGNNTETFTTNSKCAISYRGFENPYGNIWRFIKDTIVVDNILIYKNHTFNYSLPINSDWISNFGYDPEMNWAFIPAKANGANSVLPIGDYFYANSNINTDKFFIIGGKASSQDYAGIFSYANDSEYLTSSLTYSGRIMYTPTINTIYNNNINKWRVEIGGE